MSLSAVRPDRSSASAVTTLNVEPGANCPSVAVDIPSPPMPLAAASTSPVDGRIATTALAGAIGREHGLGRLLQTRRRAWCVSGVPGVGSTV